MAKKGKPRPQTETQARARLLGAVGRAGSSRLAPAGDGGSPSPIVECSITPPDLENTMHDDKTRIELVFNPRKLSVALVEAELDKRPDLTIDQLKALLAHEGGQVRPRKGVERLLDARLLALAEEAIEAASDDMVDETTTETEADAEVTTSTVHTTSEELDDMQAEGSLSYTEDDLGAMTAERLAEFGLCRMMGPDPNNPMEPEGFEPTVANTPVHVKMTNGEVHEGYYVKEQPGAMIRMRDGQDTVIYMPEGSFWVSPPEDGSGD